MAAMTVAGIDVQPGQRIMRTVDVEMDGRQVPVPIIAICGAVEGPRVAVTGGIHGAEYVAIEAARRIGVNVDPSVVRGQLVVVPIANTTSFHRRSIYTSGLDDSNLNRVFPGNVSGSPSEVLADWLFQNIIRPSQFYIDMHGGDMIEALVPFVLAPRCADRRTEETALAMALASRIPRVIHGEVQGSTVGAAVEAGIPAILAEVGGQGVWSDELVAEHMASTMRVLEHLDVLSAANIPAGPEPHVYETFAWMRAAEPGLFHPKVGVGDRVERGQPIGDVTDYFGNSVQALEAVASGEVVFLVTSLAMNVGDPLLAICA